MQRTGHSASSGVRLYKRIGEKLKNITSEVLNGSTEKRIKSDVPSVAENENPISTATDNKVVSSFPAINLGGATNFTINFNIGNKN